VAFVADLKKKGRLQQDTGVPVLDPFSDV